MEDGINLLNYSVIDFLMDEDFFQWVLYPDAQSDACWNNWLDQYPFKREEIQEARSLILLLNKWGEYCPVVPPSTLDAELKQLMLRIKQSINYAG